MRSPSSRAPCTEKEPFETQAFKRFQIQSITVSKAPVRKLEVVDAVPGPYLHSTDLGLSSQCLSYILFSPAVHRILLALLHGDLEIKEDNMWEQHFENPRICTDELQCHGPEQNKECTSKQITMTTYFLLINLSEKHNIRRKASNWICVH